MSAGAVTHEGLALGHAAAEAAATKAGEEWQEAAFAAFCEYARHTAVFVTADVRETCGIPQPEGTDLRAWGWIARRAEKEGIVTYSRHVRSTRKSTHAMRVSEWRSNILENPL